jgi:hypothetical protein
MNDIIIKDINLGGISDSIYQGEANSVAEIVNLDIHSEPGVVKVNQKMTKESGTTIDDLVKKILPCSDGLTYLFSSTSGKIWSRTSAGVYALAATASPAAGTAGISDAYEKSGYIYYTMQSRVGRVAIGAPTNWAGKDDNWATFKNKDADYHPIIEQNLDLYIGDGKDLAIIEDGVFSDSALDLSTPFRIKSLGKVLTDVLLGTFVNAYKVATSIFRWVCYGTSFQDFDELPEIGINCFLPTDNYNLINAGRKGNLYLYSGGLMQQYKKIPGNWAIGNEAQVHPNAACNMFGLPLFGLSNISGDPAIEGIYSFGSYGRNYPKALNLEFTMSCGLTGNEIGAVELVGDQLLASWKHTATGPVYTYGIDKLDSANKAVNGYVSTRAITVNRSEQKNFSVEVGYRLLPTGTSIKIYHKINYASIWTEMEEKETDADRMIVRTLLDADNANVIQFKVELNSSGNTAPEIDIIKISFP